MRLEISAVSMWLWSPGRLLEHWWTSVSIGVQGRLVLMSMRKCSSNNILELASMRKGKQAKEKVSFYHAFFFCFKIQAVTKKCHPDLAWVFLIQIIWLRKSFMDLFRGLHFTWFQISSSWQRRFAITLLILNLISMLYSRDKIIHYHHTCVAHNGVLELLLVIYYKVENTRIHCYSNGGYGFVKIML